MSDATFRDRLLNVIRVSEKREKAGTGWNSAAYDGFRLYGYMRSQRR